MEMSGVHSLHQPPATRGSCRDPELRQRGERVLRWGVHVRYSVGMEVSCGSLLTPRTHGFSVCPSSVPLERSMTSTCLLTPAALLCHIRKWQVKSATCCSSFFSFPLEATGKHFEEEGREVLSTPLPCVCFFGCPSHCAREGKKQHQSADGFLCLRLDHFPKHKVDIKGWRCGSDSAQLLCCVEGENLPWSHIHMFSQIWLPLLISHERAESMESGFLSPSFPCPHTRLESNLPPPFL